ncbi:hypothetical protein Lfu02_44000 [Longispora fulva]|uniref:Uncharacterized protein n=1 Tax=Longispora fulva TaxID=619741 RepID=A0A8J7KPZ3_9ACTN|nr:hypothetical protein [Longispora fulva]MBG6136857.1 hypothetical protein [Longispora fulva]GIG60028.1 hypothetical protein Lfu02_44000 [Longispora fulva]
MRLMPRHHDRPSWSALADTARRVLDDHHRLEDSGQCASCLHHFGRTTSWPCPAVDLAHLTLAHAARQR